MRIEYTTKCVDGGVTITVTLCCGSAAATTPPKKPDAPTAGEFVAAEQKAIPSKDKEGSGELDPTETGSGAAAGCCVVLGPIVLFCPKGEGGGGELFPTNPDD